MEKTAQNIQEAFLNNARKDKTFLTIYLMSGVKLSGRIRSFDKYSLILESQPGAVDLQARDLDRGGIESGPHLRGYRRTQRGAGAQPANPEPSEPPEG